VSRKNVHLDFWHVKQQLRLAAAACCYIGCISVELVYTIDHVLKQKVVTLNTCCDIACLTFQLPHITTGFFFRATDNPQLALFRTSNVWRNATHLNVSSVWIILLKMTFCAFPKVQWLHLTCEVDKCVTFHVKFSQDFWDRVCIITQLQSRLLLYLLQSEMIWFDGADAGWHRGDYDSCWQCCRYVHTHVGKW